jgi:hypothetical protein
MIIASYMIKKKIRKNIEENHKNKKFNYRS